MKNSFYTQKPHYVSNFYYIAQNNPITHYYLHTCYGNDKNGYFMLGEYIMKISLNTGINAKPA
jgi:hypothetical protein